MFGRRRALTGALAAIVACYFVTAAVSSQRPSPTEVLHSWYTLVLELVRHTPTYSPPVASRAFAYLGVTAYEAVASGDPALESLAGQLTYLGPAPARIAGETYDDAVVLDAALASATRSLFFNTGPTGQRAITMISDELSEKAAMGVPAQVAERSAAFGRAIANHVLAWSRDDGGAVVENMGFPLEFALESGPGKWVPTNLIAQQQLPLLPAWGENRTFAMPSGTSCPLPPPPAFSVDPASEFYKQAKEVYDTRRDLTPEQRLTARFWADDAMLSPTPPGHWISIALQVLDKEKADLVREVDVLARLGIVLADAFIGCWHEKFVYDLIRPITYIRKTIDPAFEPVLNTPPFPEYPSGHSTQSGAAAVVMTDLFGDNYAFRDATPEADGIPAREFPSFEAAAAEAGISRLYGGIHFRAAIENGLEQGRCIGAYTNALVTRK